VFSYKCRQLWINLSQRFATEFAKAAHVWRSVIRTKAETYVLINLMTGEVKDIPAERLLGVTAIDLKMNLSERTNWNLEDIPLK